MKFWNLPHIVPLAQEITLLNLKILFAKEIWAKKLFYIGPSIWFNSNVKQIELSQLL